MVGSVDLRKLDRHPGASISSPIPSLSCRRCSPNPPFAKLEMLTAERLDEAKAQGSDPGRGAGDRHRARVVRRMEVDRARVRPRGPMKRKRISPLRTLGRNGSGSRRRIPSRSRRRRLHRRQQRSDRIPLGQKVIRPAANVYDRFASA